MPKLTLSDVTNLGGNPVSAQQVINTNSDRIEAAMEKTLSRDGSTPNQMESDFDMNHYDILNAAEIHGDKLFINGVQIEGAAEWISGPGAPSINAGKLGDFYLDELTGNVYGPKTASGWGGVTANIKGPQGVQGPQGPQGLQGVQGIQGIQGSQGLQGPVGPQGTQGEKGDSFSPDAVGLAADRPLYDEEPAGFSFLDTENGYLYFKKSGASGDWTSGVTFTTGPQGPVGPQGIQGPEGPQGVQGPQGIQGPAGIGVPSGGNPGQILTKNTGADYDTSWKDAVDARDFDTISVVQNTSVDPSVNFIRTAGYSAVGDGGGALYKRVSSEPSHAGKVQSDDGAWWELVGYGNYLLPNISYLENFHPAFSTSVLVTDAVRGGTFVWRTGDYSSRVAADTLKGIYVPSALNPTGSEGCWVRDFDGEVFLEWWGAIPNQSYDCAAALQCAVDTLAATVVGGSSGGRIRLRTGDYRIGSTIEWKQRVSLHGSGMWSSYLRALGTVTDMIDVESIGTNGVSFKDMAIVGIAGQTNAFNIGSTPEITSGLFFEGVQFSNHITSVAPKLVFAAFDATYKNCWFQNNDKGLIIAGSQTNVENCNFLSNTHGVVLKKHASGSIGGGKFLGGVFGGNTYDVIIDGDTVRPTEFYGTWFEGCKSSVIGQINAPATLLLIGLTFKDCIFQPSATALAGGIVAMGNWAGRMGFEDCAIYNSPLALADVPGASWTAPQSGKSRYTVRGCIFTNGTVAGTSPRADVSI